MIKVGRKSKSFFLGITLVAVLLLVIFTSSNGSSSSSSSSAVKNSGSSSFSEMQKVDMGIGESTSPSNGNGLSDNKDNKDSGLLSGAKIDQDQTAEKEKTHKIGNNGLTDKVDTVSGSDASLKAKDDSIKKAKSEGKTGSFADSPESEALDLDLDPLSTDSNVGSVKGSLKGAAGKGKDVSGKGSSAGKEASKDTGKAKSSSAGSEKDYEYVVMIDAGSTGSRVHVYTFDTSVAPPLLIDEAFQMLKPGLSHFDTDTKGAAASLDPLLKLALDTIPKDKQRCSPVAVKATAGLRLLGTTKSDAILKEVRKHLETSYPFPVVEGEGISIMDGSDEGVYAWITTNYLLNNIGTSKRKETAAVFDLGGGSTQIVFEPTDGDAVLEGEHKYEIEFGGRKFTLYQYSHLGYGLMQARNKVNAELVKADLTSKASKLIPLLESEVKNVIAKVTLENPCVPPGVNADNVVVELEDGEKYAVNFVSPSDASGKDANLCKFLTDTILNKELACKSKSCSFNGIYQPSFDDQFSTIADMFVFSYFYDRLQPIGMPESFTLKEMTSVMENVCAGSHLWDQYFKQETHIKELEDEPLWCLDLNFMVSLLHTGYDIPLNRELKTAKTIGGNELGWCLGASLPLLDKTNWSCKVTKEF